jgi:hypothetical protein
MEYVQSDGSVASKKPYRDVPEGFVLRKSSDPRCNRCMLERGFSEDHIPPQSCGNSGTVSYRRLYADELKAPQITVPSRNGIRYVTVCAPCNNGRGPDDAAAAEFVKELRAIEKSRLVMPGTVRVPARARRVLRAVLAWFLAVRLHDLESSTDALLRDYLGGAPLDPRIVLHYWRYDSDETIIARDFTSYNILEGSAIRGTASVIKSWPIAFMLVHGEPVPDLARLDGYSTFRESAKVLLPWRRDDAPPSHWPERADPIGNVVMWGAEFRNAISSFAGYFGRAMIDDQRRRAATNAIHRIGDPERYSFLASDGSMQSLYFTR